MGDGGEGTNKYKRDGAVIGDDVYCGVSDGATLREQELGSGGGKNEGAGWIT